MACCIRLASSDRPLGLSRPSHITVVKKGMLVEGSGRRYIAGCVGVVCGQLYGSWTSVIWKSAVAGTGNEIRIRPLLSKRLYAAFRAAKVETSALGQLDPSTVRKIGSVPLVELKRVCTSSGEIVQAFDETWQLLQVRPFVPRLWKNGVVTSIGPEVLYVLSVPLPFGLVIGFGRVLRTVNATDARHNMHVMTRIVRLRINPTLKVPAFSGCSAAYVKG
jgi:hypothetical protein